MTPSSDKLDGDIPPAASWREPATTTERLPELTLDPATFQLVAEFLPTLCWVADGSGYIMWYNQGWHSYCGTKPDEMEGWGWQAVHDPAYLPTVAEQWQIAIKEGMPFEMVFPLRGADGIYRPFLTRARPVRDVTGQVKRWVGVNTEISEQVAANHRAQEERDRARAAEAQLRVSNELAKSNAERIQLALSAGAIIGTWFWDVRTDRFTVDRQFAEAFGLGAAADVDLTLDEVVATVHPDDKPGLMTAIRQVLKSGGSYAHQYRVQRQDGRYYWIEANGRVDLDESGKALRFPGVLLDLEERKTLEAERARSDAMLRAFVETMPGTVFAKDRQGRLLLVNKAACEALGASPEELLGRHELEYIGDTPQAHAIRENDRRIMETGVAEQVEEDLVLPNGQTSVFLATKSPLRDEHGDIVGVIGASFDITARKQAEEREKLLAREVDHRAKNLLAIVQSVVQLTRAETKEDFAAAILGRIEALSRAHSLLADSRWEGADLYRILHDELAPFERKGAGVIIDGPNLQLKASAAQAIALVMHELATNAAKYGAFSTGAGMLEVRWWRDRKNDQLVLSWCERGGPPVNPPSRKGFGSTMIKATIERQLRGSASLDWHQEGLRALFRLDAPEVIELERSIDPQNRAIAHVVDLSLLTGLRVLLVEDEGLIAAGTEHVLQSAGCHILGPVARLEDAFRQLYTEGRIDAAVLDVNVAGDRILPLAEALSQNGTPFLFQTGVTAVPELTSRFPDAPVIGKPAGAEVLLGALCRCVRASMMMSEGAEPVKLTAV